MLLRLFMVDICTFNIYRYCINLSRKHYIKEWIVRKNKQHTVIARRIEVIVVIFTETSALFTGQVFSWTALVTSLTRLPKFKT